MVELISQLLSKIIDEGMGVVKSNKQFKRLKEAISENMARELRYNEELLDAINKKRIAGEPDLITTLINSLTTDTFDKFIETSIPLRIVFDQYTLDENKWQNISSKIKHRNKQMPIWAKNICSQGDLLERIYHRIKILKIMSSMDIHKKRISTQYIQFLIISYQYYERMNKEMKDVFMS